MPAAGSMSVTEVSASGQHLDLDLQDSDGKDRLQIGTYTGQRGRRHCSTCQCKRKLAVRRRMKSGQVAGPDHIPVEV